jgi:ATP-dependent RNA helicase HelY
MNKSELSTFASSLKFELDPFQVKACVALEAGHGVLVCAPTGAGKTVVGEFAVHLALAAGRKCFYTTPIKALSNQKYAELVERYGPDEVGLLTGDSSINSDAPVVVMTTEVLRNMLYANSEALRGLSHVVMDEVHYLADRFRGAVWEEVILHLSEDVRLVSLSATVSNAEEFGAWMETVRGDTTVVVDETRPIPLWQHIMVGRRIFDLFDSRSHPAAGPKTVLVDQDLVRHVKQRQALERVESWQPRGRGRRGSYQSSNDFRPLPRPDVIAQLDQSGLLPAITFIFSRAGCDAALAQCLRSRLDLTSPEQVREIDTIIEKHTGELPEEDLEVLGYRDWCKALRRGLASHHAGMLPAFRQTVEELFVKGLVRAVFATETLALGINMPARTVVLERLVKYNGESHAELTPGEYTQLTGRPTRHRRRRPRCGPVAARGRADGCRRFGVDTDVPAPQFVPPLVQHVDQSRRTHGRGGFTEAARTFLRAVPSGSLGGRPGAWHRAERRSTEGFAGETRRCGRRILRIRVVA